MANVTETSTWEAGIYQLETTDPVEGGELGISNLQARLLGNRTKWLFDKCNPFLYEVRELDIPDSELATFTSLYFNGTGLGVDLFEGWAICNGQNGTRNRGGRTSIGWRDGDTIGAIGGSRNAVVVDHSHTFKSSGRNIIGTGTIQVIKSDGETTNYTQSAGESGIDKNMQPYIITLFIQKIA